MDSIAVSLDPNSMQIDKYNKLWVLCSGGINIVKPNLLRIDLNSNSIEKTFTFTDISMSPTHLKINRDGEELFFINNSVYKMNVMDSVLSTTEIIKNEELFSIVSNNLFSNFYIFIQKKLYVLTEVR